MTTPHPAFSAASPVVRSGRQARRRRGWLLAAWLLLGLASHPAAGQAPPPPPPLPPGVNDPGPRALGGGAGGPLAGLSADEQNFFLAARDRFREIDSVSGTLPGEPGIGLGPRYNGNSCAACHAQPTVGGSSPAVNPLVALATLNGARNILPAFLTLNGPARAARFARHPDGSPDGGVHDLFVISGRPDAGNCQIVQPDFAGNLAAGNVGLRIPTPIFGLGLVEAVPDDYLLGADAAHAGLKQALGVTGQFNHSANDGTISRFGWKAQNKSLLIFAGEAYNVEQGATNEIFPNKRETDPNCLFNALPEDRPTLRPDLSRPSLASAFASDTVNFATFMRLSAAPVPAPPTASSQNGRAVFQAIGCQACHFESQVTGASTMTGQSFVTFAPFSDFALHRMGTALADGITQGEAAGQDWRTAPLWGAGQRLFFLHDGRTGNLVTAIQLHASPGSEANNVINNFNLLLPAQKQDLVNFLRSL